MRGARLEIRDKRKECHPDPPAGGSGSRVLPERFRLMGRNDKAGNNR